MRLKLNLVMTIINVQCVGWTFPKIVNMATEGAETEVCKIKGAILKYLLYSSLDCGTEYIANIVLQIDCLCILLRYTSRVF